MGGKGDKGEKGDGGFPGDIGPRGDIGPKGDPGSRGVIGGLYTRWGSRSCPSDRGTELVYVGMAGGSDRGTDYFCFPFDPDYPSHNMTGHFLHTGWSTIMASSSPKMLHVLSAISPCDPLS